jgi:hypothetical protein
MRSMLSLGDLDLANVKHIYRFEPNPFLPELAVQINNLSRLASYLTSDAYREIYENYLLHFDAEKNNDMNKKSRHLWSKRSK